MPESLSVGGIIRYAHEQFVNKRILNERYTFAGGVFFDRMKANLLYATDVNEIEKRVEKAGLKQIFA